MVDEIFGDVSMKRDVVIIRPTAVFIKPSKIIAGKLLTSPPIIPFGNNFYFYFTDGSNKSIKLITEITTSPIAIRDNLHGYTYTGDIIEEDDISEGIFISNLPYQDALKLYEYLIKLQN
jgi:hypothetical protein